MKTMKHSINPLVDCVFKALLGDQKNINLTLHFLNAVIKPKHPIQNIQILNPYNEREFLSDKLTIVDIKVQDSEENSYQIEVQLAVFAYLPTRMLYTWSDIYQAQLGSGENFTQLKPVVSIWLLGENLFDTAHHHHHFQAYDPVNQVQLSEHFSIHVLELAKWKKQSDELDQEAQWLYFFQQAKDWDRLPNDLDNPEMRQAMQILNKFSEKEKAYHLYQTRQNALRDEATKKHLLEDAERRSRVAEQEKHIAQQQKNEAQHREYVADQLRNEAEQQKKVAEMKLHSAMQQAEVEKHEKERLIALLNKAGIQHE